MRLLLLALALLAWPLPLGHAESARTQYEAALGELRLGHPAVAAADLAALADAVATTDPELAAEALFRAAQLQDEQLSAPAVARRLYGQLSERYPDSRFTARARRRASELAALLETDPAVLREFNQVATAYLTLGVPTVIARLTRLLAENPGFSQADRALYLLGSAYRLAGPGSARLAEQTLHRLLTTYPASPFCPAAERSLAELALDRGDYQTARQRFQQLAHYPQPLWQQAAQQGLAACRYALFCHRLAQGCWLCLLVVGGALAERGRRHLLPPPLEILYYAPVGAFLVLCTLLSRGAHARGAMAGLALGGSLLAWLSGAAARRPGGLVLGLLGRLLAACAICYLAVYYGGLLNKVIETWRTGPQSG